MAKKIQIKNNKIINNLVIIVVSLFIINFLYKKTGNWVKQKVDRLFKFTKKSDEDKTEEKATITVGKAKELCARVITDTYWFKSDKEVYKELRELKINDLIKVSNVWVDFFHDENGGLSLSEFIVENKIVLNEDMRIVVNKLREYTNFI